MSDDFGACPIPCDPDCEAGVPHCVNVHLPRHKRDHEPQDCGGYPRGGAAMSGAQEG